MCRCVIVVTQRRIVRKQRYAISAFGNELLRLRNDPSDNTAEHQSQQDRRPAQFARWRTA